MMTPAQRRRAWVDELNGLFANLASADQRIEKAEKSHAQAMQERSKLLLSRRESVALLVKKQRELVPVVFSPESTPDERLNAIDAINDIKKSLNVDHAAYLERVEELNRAVNRWNSERGTARQQRADWEKKIAAIIAKLSPEISDPLEAEFSEAAEAG